MLPHAGSAPHRSKPGTAGSWVLAPASKSHDMSSLHDRDQTSHPPLVPMPLPTSKADQEIRQAVEEARHRDPTAITGQAG
jgi:hypothetical protein